MTKRDGLFREALAGLIAKRTSLEGVIRKANRQIAALNRVIRVMSEDSAPAVGKTETLTLLASRFVRSDSFACGHYTVEAFANGSYLEYHCSCMAFRFAPVDPLLGRNGAKKWCKHIKRALARKYDGTSLSDAAREEYRRLRGMTPGI